MSDDKLPRPERIKMSVFPIPKEILQDLQYDLIDVKLFQKNVLDRSDFILLKSYSSNQEKVEILMEIMRGKNQEAHSSFLEVMDEDYNWLRDKCEIFFQKIQLDAAQNGTKSLASSTQAPSTFRAKVDEEEEFNSIEENDRSSPVKKKIRSSLVSVPITSNEDHKKTKTVTKVEKDMNVTPTNRIDKLNKIITPEMMTIVRRNYRVARKWSTLAHILGMTPIVHTLRMRVLINGEDNDASILHLLEEWKGSHPKEASLGRLIEALREEGFNDAADELEEKFVS